MHAVAEGVRMNTQPKPAMSASEAPGLTTMGRTVVVGPPDPSQGDYSRLAYGPPEPHLSGKQKADGRA